MNHNYKFRNVNEALPRLLRDLERDGDEVGSRAGRVKEFTHVGITIDKPLKRELLLGERKHNIAAQIAEAAWVLAGRNDIEFLGHYLPRAKDFSDDGQTWRAGYGPRLRQWNNHNPSYTGTSPVDQLDYVVELLRRDPLSRQAVMSIWDPVIDTQPGKDIPCNDWLSWSSRLGKLDLHVAVRSNDAMWGWSGINVFEWSVLQEVVAGMLGIEVGALHFSTTSFHLYDRHWAKAHRIHEHYACSLEPRVTESPRFNPTGFDDVSSLDEMLRQWFNVESLIRRGHDGANDLVDLFPEPMFQSFLRVLQWWWTGDRSFLEPIEGTALEVSTRLAVQPPERQVVTDGAGKVVGHWSVLAEEQAEQEWTLSPGSLVVLPDETSKFIEELCALHLEKHAAYGDSWKRRGEMLGILANIARKVDRLGGAETSDETSADTAGDLLVYLAKYRTWLDDRADADDPELANEVLRQVDRKIGPSARVGVFDRQATERWLQEEFEVLAAMVAAERVDRYRLVNSMITQAYLLAYRLSEQARATANGRDAALVGRSHDGDDYRGADVD